MFVSNQWVGRSRIWIWSCSKCIWLDQLRSRVPQLYEGWYVLRVWYEENRGYEEEPTVQYPIDISQETEEGIVTVTLTSDEEMEEIYSNCPDDD